jgi:hypothetical protein
VLKKIMILIMLMSALTFFSASLVGYVNTNKPAPALTWDDPRARWR